MSSRSDLPTSHWAREWAGEYYVGDHLGMNIEMSIAPEAGVTYSDRGCVGVYESNHGDVIGTFDEDGDGRADGVRVKWTSEPHRNGFDSEKLYFVRWDGANGGMARHYLVPEAHMADFVMEYNRSPHPNEELMPEPQRLDASNGRRISVNRPGAPVVGAPHLPAKWAQQLRSDR